MKKEKQSAGFWIRLLAFIVDIVIVFIPLLIMSNLIFFRSDFVVLSLATGIDIFYLVVTMWFYYCLQVASNWQATLGMKLMGIKIIDKQQNAISLAKATKRYFLAFLSGLIFFMGFLLVFITKEKASLHDKITNTRIIYS